MSHLKKTFCCTTLFGLFMATSSRNEFIPSAGQGIMTLLFATFSMMASPGSVKVGASEEI